MKRTSILRQKGATLIVSLLLLLIVTIMGLATMRSSTMEERMARYTREQAVAFQAAEAALLDAEIDLSPSGTRVPPVQGIAGFAADCNAGTPAWAGLCLQAAAGLPTWLARMDVAGATVNYGTFSGSPALSMVAGSASSVARQPRYIVEGINTPIPGIDSIAVGKTKPRYRVTAVGFGPRADVQVWLQATYRPGY
ncbi:PilX N-terminal domain-containing pilus assembly protein [Niveibacterium sp.]|uniref:pilus assembly PilX family protein n=1 Tax=Niveibacterium sp. TaxID=2017444 RepID=UPI0035B41290